MPAIEDSLQRSGTAEVIVFLSPAAADSSAEAAGAAAGMPLGVADAGAMTPRAAPVSEALAGYFLTGEEVDDPERAGAALSVPDRRRRARRSRESRDWEAIVNGARQPPRLYPNLGVMLGTVDEAGLEALRGDARVEKVTGTPVIELIRPNRVAAASTGGQHTWGIRAMRVPQLWADGLTGEGVLVGHLDTGVDGEHPALRGAISAFAAFDTFGRQVKPDPQPFDTDDHGTHTAATIAGREAGGRRVGVAPGAALASAVVIEGGQVVARVLGGMDWAVAQRARILNLSLGLRGFHDDFLTLTQRLRDLNILPVFAVGNEGVHTSRSPGNYGEALSVGAHDRFGRIPEFSSSERFVRAADALVPDLVAPGVGVVSARPGGGFQQMDGTSMATPHVAGLAALLMQAHPDSTVTEVEEAIFRSCRRPAGMLEDRCNRGVPDAVRALAAL